MGKDSKEPDAKDSDTISISGLVELSKSVGANTADIEKLKKDTRDIVGLRKEMVELKMSVMLNDQKLDTLAASDVRIEKTLDDIGKGNIKFRYWLWVVLGGFVAYIGGTLAFGVNVTAKNQATLERNLQAQITTADKRHTTNHRDLTDLIRELSKDINSRSRE